MAVSAQQQAAPVAAAASSPVAAASAPVAVPAATAATQSQQPIAITIQMPPTPQKDAVDVLSALLTPTIAIIAVYVAVMNARTAHKKLRLDLFAKRYEVFKTIEDKLREMIFKEAVSDEDFMIFVDAINQSEFVCSSKVHDYFAGNAFEHAKKYKVALDSLAELKGRLSRGIWWTDEQTREAEEHRNNIDTLKEKLMEEEAQLHIHFKPFLRVSE
jgi:hypothetical protein